MVFGWSKKKEETQHIPTQTQSQTITLSDIRQILEKQKESRQKQILQQTKPHFEQIQNELASISKIIAQLKSDDLKVEDIDRNLKTLVVRSKSEVIEIVSKESQKTMPKISSFDDVIKASDIASHCLKKIGDVLGKNSRVIHVFAKKYAHDLKSHLGQITSSHLEISKQLGDYSAFDLKSSSIQDKVAKLANTINEINEKTSQINKANDFQIVCTDVIDTTQQKIAALLSSPQFSEFLEIRKQIEQIKADEEKLDKEIDDEFSKISRPLGKYVYVTSLEKPLKQVLEKITQSPSSMISKENKDSIVTVLESCMKGIVSGTVSVKESDKSVSQMTHLISLLDGFISQKDNLQFKLHATQKKLEIFDYRNLEDLEKKLARTKTDKAETEIKIKNHTSELEQNITQKHKLLLEIQDSLGTIAGAKYTIHL